MNRFFGYCFLVSILIDCNCGETTSEMRVFMHKLIHTPIEPIQYNSKCESQKRTICYFMDHPSKREKLAIEDIDVNLCTHIIYGNHAMLNGDARKYQYEQQWNDTDDKFVENVATFKKKGIKVLMGINSERIRKNDTFHETTELNILYSSDMRHGFVEAAEAFVKKHRLDGVDLTDLNYPLDCSGNCDFLRELEKENFTELVKELSETFKPQGFIVSAALSANIVTAAIAYDIPNLSKYLDWITLQQYDNHHSFGDRIESNTPFADPDSLNVKASINYWIKNGAAPEKLILSVYTFGWVFPKEKLAKYHTDIPLSWNEWYNIKYGEFNELTPGALAFDEICAKIKRDGWKAVRQISPTHFFQSRTGLIAYENNSWVSFDDTENMHVKGKFICEMNLGGAAIWDLSSDDAHDSCECGKFPLITALNDEIRISNSPKQFKIICSIF